MQFELYTNEELVGFIENRQHYKLSQFQLARLIQILDERLGELRYGR